MRRTHAPNQEHPQQRVVWLAALPHGKPTMDPVHAGRRQEAHRLAQHAGSCVVGEFLYAPNGDDALPAHVWQEVLAFLEHLEAGVLVAVRADEIATDPGARELRHASLEEAGIRLVGLQEVQLLRGAA